MTSHILPTSATTTTTTAPPGAWETLSEALTSLAPDLSGRRDLIVTCAPGAGGDAPARYLPDLGVIEIDGRLLPMPPESADPARPADRARYPTLWGAFVHEAAHAAHSAWLTPTAWAEISGTAVGEAAMVLEESRAEAVQMRRRPGDRRWLRATIRDLVLADTAADTASGPRMNRWDAATTAGLLLARVDPGVLTAADTSGLTPVLNRVLGVRRLRALRWIWRRAQTTADTDTASMLALARRWCRVVGLDPDKPAPTRPTRGRGRSKLAKAITDTLDDVAATSATDDAEGVEAEESPAVTRRAAERAAETAVREDAKRAARRVFHPTSARTRTSPVCGTRPPTTAEQSAARRLARALRAAGTRERVEITTSSPTPPGRLRMRQALAADAQRAAGAVQTAQPFTSTVRRYVPTPPLRLGIACDISGSMASFAGPVASAAWILARAAGHIPDARAATVVFGEHVHAVARPGHRPTQVAEFTAYDRTENFIEAVDALDAALDLTRRDAARLLVIVSDGDLVGPGQRAIGQKRITRLHESGCGVVWLGLGHSTWAMDHTHLVALTDPADAVGEIARAAVRALSTTG